MALESALKFCDDVNGGQYENDSNSSADDKLFVLFCRSVFDCVARKGRLHSQDTVLKVENVDICNWRRGETGGWK